MKETLKLSVALGVVCTVAAALLAFADARTAGARRQAEFRERMKALEQVLPPFDNQPLEDAVECGGVKFYRARIGGALAGIAGEGAADQGFGGELRVLVGLAPDGGIRTVVVTAHKETPGLGTQATDRKTKKTIGDLFQCSSGGCGAPPPGLPANKFLNQFGSNENCRYASVDQAPFKVSQDGGKLDAVSGATVSSRAVADAVTRVAVAFTQSRTEIVGGN